MPLKFIRKQKNGIINKLNIVCNLKIKMLRKKLLKLNF